MVGADCTTPSSTMAICLLTSCFASSRNLPPPAPVKFTSTDQSPASCGGTAVADFTTLPVTVVASSRYRPVTVPLLSTCGSTTWRSGRSHSRDVVGIFDPSVIDVSIGGPSAGVPPAAPAAVVVVVAPGTVVVVAPGAVVVVVVEPPAFCSAGSV